MNLNRIQLLTAYFGLTAFLGNFAAAQSTAEPPLSQRLAQEFSRVVLTYMHQEPLTLEAVEAATLLAEEAVRVDPEGVDNWRLLLEVALLTERNDLLDKSVDNILRLDPHDDVVRLLRLNRAIDHRQTAEERIAAYEQLLDAANIDRIGATVASRLAMDLALLYRRVGNTEGFTDALTRAMSWDSANHAAAALAAGYFRANVKDPFAEAEMLVNVVLANPTDIPTHVALATLLLENGAYESASRLFDLAVNSTVANGLMADTDLIIDQAIARWARGDVDMAMELLNKRTMEIDADYRSRVRAKQPEMPFEQVPRIRAPKDPPLAAAQAVISTSLASPKAEAFATMAIEAYRGRIAELQASTSAPPSSATTQPDVQQEVPAAEQLALLNLEAAWLSVWLGSEIEAVPNLLGEAQKNAALSKAAQDRFEGWVTLRRGDAVRAIELLAPLAATDPAARLGLGLALLEQGRTREAAVELLGVARAQPGSLMGIWAANRLLGLLGQRVSISAHAARLNELIGTIPSSIDRAPTSLNTAVSLRLEASQTNLSAYEPIVVRLKITNNTSRPLAISAEGPIKPQVVMIVSASAANLPMLDQLDPFVVEIDQRLRLEPREVLEIPVDLRRHGTGALLNQIARNGSLLNVRAYINFYATTNGALKAGLYGSEVSAPMLRVDGARVTEQWINDTLGMMAAPEFPQQPGMLSRLALLGHRIGARPHANITEDETKLLENASVELASAFAKLDDPSKSWILAVVPYSERFEKVLEAARQSPSRIVMVAYLLSQAKKDDPMVAAAMRSGDPVLQRFGEFLTGKLERDAQAAEQEALPSLEALDEKADASGDADEPVEPRATSRPLSLPPSATPAPE